MKIFWLVVQLACVAGVAVFIANHGSLYGAAQYLGALTGHPLPAFTLPIHSPADLGMPSATPAFEQPTTLTCGDPDVEQEALQQFTQRTSVLDAQPVGQTLINVIQSGSPLFISCSGTVLDTAGRSWPISYNVYPKHDGSNGFSLLLIMTLP